MDSRQLKLEDVEFSITCESEHSSPKDSFDDQETVEDILLQAIFNDWRWCRVKVTGKFLKLETSQYLGGCSYENEDDFKKDEYYKDLQKNVLKQLQAQIDAIIEWVENDSTVVIYDHDYDGAFGNFNGPLLDNDNI